MVCSNETQTSQMVEIISDKNTDMLNTDSVTVVETLTPEEAKAKYYEIATDVDTIKWYINGRDQPDVAPLIYTPLP